MARIRPILRFGSKILFVGEAPGEREAELGRPFCGASGSELYKMLAEAEIESGLCSLTNVFLDRPDKNQLSVFGITKKALEEQKKRGDQLAIRAWNAGLMGKGFYCAPERIVEVDRLYEEIALINPNIVVALGNTALWALTGRTGIGAYRGTTMMDKTGKFKILGTYHPAAVLRDFKFRTIVIADLIKAKRESKTKELSRLKRDLIIEPTISDLHSLLSEMMSAEVLSEDIETFGGQITCIALAPSPTRALVIPFADRRKENNSYWATPFEERQAIEFLQQVNRGPSIKLFQNGIYDVQYLARLGIYPFNWREDTMLFHHSCWAALPKGLDFLGSIYTDEFAWKRDMKTRGRDKLKREE
jgi:DNA polymerase